MTTLCFTRVRPGREGRGGLRLQKGVDSEGLGPGRVSPHKVVPAPPPMGHLPATPARRTSGPFMPELPGVAAELRVRSPM